jgi:hypothetical protein
MVLGFVLSPKIGTPVSPECPGRKLLGNAETSTDCRDRPRSQHEPTAHRVACAWFQERGNINGGTAYWYGIDQYLYYTMNDCWKAGLRFEWFRDEDGTRVGLNRPSNPNNPPYVGNFFSLTFGLNWTPTANLTVRPEIRADWYDGKQARLPYDDGTEDSQLLLGVDVIWRF